MNPRILMIGGDNTSDRFGAALASKIHELCPQATVYGVGGPLMNDAGVRLLSDISEIVSLGVLQSMRGSTVIKRLIARVVETMDQEEPALVLQIGLPVFGLKILEIARTRSIPVLYYYTPFSRGLTHADLRKFCGVVTKVAAISRTEEALCRDAGLDVEFVGHPLMDLADRSVTPSQAREKLGIAAEGRVAAVLPGAREVEVKNVLPAVLKALCQLTKDHPELQIIISAAATIRTTLVEKILQNALQQRAPGAGYLLRAQCRRCGHHVHWHRAAGGLFAGSAFPRRVPRAPHYLFRRKGAGSQALYDHNQQDFAKGCNT